MSRHGYVEECDDYWQSIRWSGAIKRALRGRRGQAFLRDLVVALDALPAPRLIGEELENENGEFCALGAVGRVRGLDMSKLDTEDHHALSAAFGIPRTLAAEVMYENDEGAGTPERRFAHVRRWALRNLRPETLIGEPEPELETDE